MLNLLYHVPLDMITASLIFGLFILDVELVVRVIVFFDDGRVYGLGSERIQSGLRKICAGSQFIGNQEDSRKHTAG